MKRLGWGWVMGCETRMRLKTGLVIFSLAVLFFSSNSFAEEKKWRGFGDGVDWNDPTNWEPEGVPTTSDEVIINKKDAPVSIKETFYAQYVEIGRNRTATLSNDEFVTGVIAPTTNTEIATFNRRYGTLKLKGSGGRLRLRGRYVDSETPAADQPS